jgi:hypothetical protein
MSGLVDSKVASKGHWLQSDHFFGPYSEDFEKVGVNACEPDNPGK